MPIGELPHTVRLIPPPCLTTSTATRQALADRRRLPRSEIRSGQKMIPNASLFAGQVVMAVTNDVSIVLGVRIPSKIDKSDVVWIAVLMAHLLPRKGLADERAENEGMNPPRNTGGTDIEIHGWVWAAMLTQFDTSESSDAADRVGDSPFDTPHAPLVAHFIRRVIYHR